MSFTGLAATPPEGGIFLLRIPPNFELNVPTLWAERNTHEIFTLAIKAERETRRTFRHIHCPAAANAWSEFRRIEKLLVSSLGAIWSKVRAGVFWMVAAVA